jgi:hypothetical protein
VEGHLDAFQHERQVRAGYVGRGQPEAGMRGEFREVLGCHRVGCRASRVQPGHVPALLEKPGREMRADEPGCSSHKRAFHAVSLIIIDGS